jgi:hypothetical protein
MLKTAIVTSAKTKSVLKLSTKLPVCCSKNSAGASSKA